MLMIEILEKNVENIAQQNNIDIQEGVYVCMSGPNYETPAEIKMVRVIGGDAVGMSTVPEVIVANHSQIKVIGISCMTNMAAGILDKPLEHREVIETSKIASGNFKKLSKEYSERHINNYSLLWHSCIILLKWLFLSIV